jgi:hypothetical protein
VLKYFYTIQIGINSSTTDNETMNYIYVLKAQKVAKYSLIAVVLIVPFHLTFTLKDTFQLNRKERIISKKLNLVEKNVSTVQPKKCYTESVGVDIILCSYLMVFQTSKRNIFFHELQ